MEIHETDKEAISTAYSIMSHLSESEYMDWEREIGNGITVLLEKPQDIENVEIVLVVKDTQLDYEQPQEYTNSLKTHSDEFIGLCEELEGITGIEGLDFLCDPFKSNSVDYWDGYSPTDH